ncbi:MAG: DUF2007 domain-containing protein [Phycisphaerae bacterium]|nr:DUF2007 domain-containing protein [Phycisphaerae bacterium]
MNEKLVTVARYTDYMDADLARQMLEDEGIKAFVMGQNSGVAWGVPPVNHIELQTPESQAQEAKEILEAAGTLESGEGPESGEDDDWDDDDLEPGDDLDSPEEQE